MEAIGRTDSDEQSNEAGQSFRPTHSRCGTRANATSPCLRPPGRRKMHGLQPRRFGPPVRGLWPDCVRRNQGMFAFDSLLALALLATPPETASAGPAPEL